MHCEILGGVNVVLDFTAKTTMNGPLYLVTATGAMRTASMSTPKWFCAYDEMNVIMRLRMLEPHF